MRSAILFLCLCFGCQVVLLATAGFAQAIPRYTLTDLGDLPGGGNSSIAFGINNRGQVVGSSLTSGGRIVDGREVGTRHAFLWTPDSSNGTRGSMIDLGIMPGSESVAGTALHDYAEAHAINDYGQVVGYNGLNAFLWTPHNPNGAHGSMTDIGSLGGVAAAASSINNHGQVVGWSNDPERRRQAVLWTPATPNGTRGTLISLGASAGTAANRASDAYDINDSGQVVGKVTERRDLRDGGYTYIHSAYFWDTSSDTGETRVVDARRIPYPFEHASAINSAGQVATDHILRAAYIVAPGDFRIQGTLEGVAAFLDLNDSWEAVGGWNDSALPDDDRYGRSRAIVWTLAEGAMDLNTLLDDGAQGWTLLRANGINQLGQIVGMGMFDVDNNPLTNNSEPRGFLLTPLALDGNASVPEPTILAMLSLAAVLIRRRERFRL